MRESGARAIATTSGERVTTAVTCSPRVNTAPPSTTTVPTGAVRSSWMSSDADDTETLPAASLAQTTTLWGPSTAGRPRGVLGSKGTLELDQAYEIGKEKTLTLARGGRKKARVFRKSDQFAPDATTFVIRIHRRIKQKCVNASIANQFDKSHQF